MFNYYSHIGVDIRPTIRNNQILLFEQYYVSVFVRSEYSTVPCTYSIDAENIRTLKYVHATRTSRNVVSRNARGGNFVYFFSVYQPNYVLGGIEVSTRPQDTPRGQRYAQSR